MPPFIIDAHEDLAYLTLTFGRDYLRSAHETRQAEMGTSIPQNNGHTMLGWPEFQRGQVALVFGTIFIAERGALPEWETQVYRTPSDADRLWQTQVEYYQRLAGDHPECFQFVLNQVDLHRVTAPWRMGPALPPVQPAEGEDAPAAAANPVGLLLLMENAEGLRSPRELEEWHARGMRMVGPVWAARGMRFCAGTRMTGGFTREGQELLEVMAGLGLALDISHMNERSTLQAADRFEGHLAATHANCRALLRHQDDERHLTDQTIRALVERGGVIGVSPRGKWLRPGWSSADDVQQTTLAHLVAHIDHICQLAGDARHVGIGTDFDGGWGWPEAPYELDTIADLPKLGLSLAEAGYSSEDVAAVLGGNWFDFLERSLPDR
jgi:membrane dipeptidase